MLNKMLVPIYTMMVYTILCNTISDKIIAQVITIAMVVIIYEGVVLYDKSKQRRIEECTKST